MNQLLLNAGQANGIRRTGNILFGLREGGLPFYCESDSFVGLGLAAYRLFSRSKWTTEVKCHAFNWN